MKPIQILCCGLMAVASICSPAQDPVYTAPNTARTTASDPPFDLKEDRLGMTLADFKAKYTRYARGSSAPLPFCSDTRPNMEVSTLLSEPYMQAAGIVNCRTNYPFEEARDSGRPTIANVPTNILIYHFVDGSLYRITAWFPHSGFAQVKAAMVEKYGPASLSKSDVYQNRMGAKFDGETLLWTNAGSSAALVERFGDLDTSTLVFIHRELNEKAELRKPKPRPDL